jgi:hypothetical protein
MGGNNKRHKRPTIGLADPSRLKPFDKDEETVHVIMGSRKKFAFDEQARVFTLKKVLYSLPIETAFPAHILRSSATRLKLASGEGFLTNLSCSHHCDWRRKSCTAATIFIVNMYLLLGMARRSQKVVYRTVAPFCCGNCSQSGPHRIKI